MNDSLPIKTQLSETLIQQIGKTNPGYLEDDNLYASLGAGPAILLTLDTLGFSHMLNGKLVNTYAEVQASIPKYDILAHKILLLYRNDIHQIWTIRNSDFEPLHFIIAKGKPIAYYGVNQQIHLINKDCGTDNIG